MMEQPDDGIAMAQELAPQRLRAPILMLTSVEQGDRPRLRQGRRAGAGRRVPDQADRARRPLVARSTSCSNEEGEVTMLMTEQRSPAGRHRRAGRASTAPAAARSSPILQEVQRKYRHDLRLRHAGRRRPAGHPSGRGLQRGLLLRLPARSEPQGQFVIRLCRTISCDMAGKDARRPAARERPGHRLRRDHRRRQVHAGVGQLPGHVRPGPGAAGQRPGLHPGHAREGARDPRGLPRAASAPHAARSRQEGALRYDRHSSKTPLTFDSIEPEAGPEGGPRP